MMCLLSVECTSSTVVGSIPRSADVTEIGSSMDGCHDISEGLCLTRGQTTHSEEAHHYSYCC